MIKRLMTGLVAVALALVLVPGMTLAKDDGKSACKGGGWQELVRADGTVFADQGACVSYVARGGTPTTPFEAKCAELGGVPTTAIRCDWTTDLDPGTLVAMWQALEPFCPVGSQAVGTYMDPGPENVHCES